MRNAATRLDFMKRFATVESEYDNLEQKKEFQKLRKYILKNEKQLHYSNPGEILKFIGNYKDSFGVDMNLCRIVGLLAVMRDTNDLDGIALDYTGEMIDSVSENKEIEAYLLSSFIFFGFGRAKEALEESEKLLEKVKKCKDQDSVNNAKANIAYFIAELGDKTKESQARSCISEARDLNRGGNPQEAAFLDTEGYVKIIFGKNFEEVLEGLNCCGQAYKQCKSEDKEIAKSFLEFHRYKACRRLLQLCK